MNVQNLLSKLKQRMGIQQNDSVSGENYNTDSIEGQDDDYDDDYLLVCVPAKKANIEAVSHSQTVPNQNVQNDVCSTVSDCSECHRNEILLQCPSSAVIDVPFSLHPVLNAHRQAKAMFHHINLEPCAFNYMKYSHNFVSEKLCLRDMNSDELANIDEFLIPPGDLQKSAHIPSRNSEVNLMQF